MFAISTSALVTALTLCATLTGVVRAGDGGGPHSFCIDTVASQKGDTCQTIAEKYVLNMTYIEAVNPDIKCNCDQALRPHTKLCINQVTPSCITTTTANTTNCNQLAAWADIDRTHLLEFNKNLDEKCDNLHVGDTICIMSENCYRKDGRLLCGSD